MAMKNTNQASIRSLETFSRHHGVDLYCARKARRAVTAPPVDLALQ